jgi:putative transcriptional regulator
MKNEEIASNIRMLRGQHGETQAEAAKAIGVSSSAWSMYEVGSRIPRDDVKLKIAKHFDTTVGAIFFGSDAHMKLVSQKRRNQHDA